MPHNTDLVQNKGTESRVLQLDAADNVAVAISALVCGSIATTNDKTSEPIVVLEPIAAGHKVALVPLAIGDAVIKYGVPIGYATSAIKAGAWVHTHNCRSPLDERSHTLDPHSGSTTDTPYV